LNGLGREHWEGFGDANRRNTTTLRVPELGHGVDLRRRSKIEMLAGSNSTTPLQPASVAERHDSLFLHLLHRWCEDQSLDPGMEQKRVPRKLPLLWFWIIASQLHRSSMDLQLLAIGCRGELTSSILIPTWTTSIRKASTYFSEASQHRLVLWRGERE
jgi:hypothetical protein